MHAPHPGSAAHRWAVFVVVAEALMEFCHMHDVAQRGVRTPQRWTSWRESTDQLFAAIMRSLNRKTAPTALPAGT